jgi:hypothetical protein
MTSGASTEWLAAAAAAAAAVVVFVVVAAQSSVRHLIAGSSAWSGLFVAAESVDVGFSVASSETLAATNIFGTSSVCRTIKERRQRKGFNVKRQGAKNNQKKHINKKTHRAWIDKNVLDIGLEGNKNNNLTSLPILFSFIFNLVDLAPANDKGIQVAHKHQAARCQADGPELGSHPRRHDQQQQARGKYQRPKHCSRLVHQHHLGTCLARQKKQKIKNKKKQKNNKKQ